MIFLKGMVTLFHAHRREGHIFFTFYFKPPPPSHLVIYDQSLRRLQTLRWSYNIETLRKKNNQRIDLLRRVHFLLSQQSRITLYNALILSLFDYAEITWGDKNNATLM